MASRLALYRKWRPTTFDEVSGQEHVTGALRAQVVSGRVSHAYLFTGTRGTGKTTCAKILARAVCCEHPINGNPCNECSACRSILDESALDVSEIDAASNNSVDDVRALRDEMTFTPNVLKKRVYIIDEVHMLSGSAFNALLKTLEEPPEHVLFILATTELHKVPATILSRCQRFDFRRIPSEIIGARLHLIAEQEGYTLDDDACVLLARLADGSMRDGVSLLDRSLPGSGRVTRAMISEALGVAPAETITSIAEAVINGDAAQALSIFSDSYLDGRDVLSLFDEFLSLLRDLYILRATGRGEYLVSSADPAALRELARRASSEELEYYVSCVSDLMTRLTRTAIRRTDGEMCLMKMALNGRGTAAAESSAVRPRPEGSGPAPSVPSRQLPPDSTPESKPQSTTEVPPWNEPITVQKESAPSVPQEANSGEPEQRIDAAAKVKITSSVGDRLRDAFLTIALDKVPRSTHFYLRSADFLDKNGVLVIRVNDAVLNILNKPNMLEVLQEAAHALSYNDVRVEKLAPEKTPSTIDSLLENARQLGVQTN